MARDGDLKEEEEEEEGGEREREREREREKGRKGGRACWGRLTAL